MTKALVTGGTGFIGSHLAESLLERGYEVVVLDNLSTGRNKLSSDIDFRMGCILHIEDQPLKGIDYVFHLAARPSVPRSISSPLSTHETNSTGTLKVLLKARELGAKVVFSSSSSVYGDSIMSTKSEDLTPQPLSPYAVSKLTGEQYCEVFKNIYGLPTACLRYFNVYGPRQDPHSGYSAVIPKFIKQAVASLPRTVTGDGLQTRDFTFVKDVVEANILVAESLHTGIFNISAESSITVVDLAEVITRLTGATVDVQYLDPRPGDIKHSLASIAKARATLGYEPRFSLEDGLKETIEWYRAQQ